MLVFPVGNSKHSKTIIKSDIQDSQINTSMITRGPQQPKTYGLVHEVFFDSENSVQEQVPAWMIDGTYIMYGVCVESPRKQGLKVIYSTITPMTHTAMLISEFLVHIK